MVLTASLWLRTPVLPSSVVQATTPSDSQAVVPLALLTRTGTINGGVGSDTINLDATTGSVQITALTAAVNIAYQAGDVIVLTNTSIAGGAAYNGNVYVGASGVGVSAGTTLTVGNRSLLRRNRHLLASPSHRAAVVLVQVLGLAFRVMGVDLVTSGIVNSSGVTTANFTSRLSTANSGLTITLL